MTTEKIESLADVGGLAQPDINLKSVLRNKIVPEFYHDVGYVSWRRKTATLALTAGVQSGSTTDLATDFDSMMDVSIHQAPPLKDTPLTYIGDDPVKIAKAEANTVQSKPTGWYLIRPSATTALRRMKFDAPSDAAYTVYYTYYSRVVFADDAAIVDMDGYIPTKFQWGLVEGLKAYLYGVRYGMGDQRYAAATQEFEQYKARAAENLELSRGAKPRFVA